MRRAVPAHHAPAHHAPAQSGAGVVAPAARCGVARRGASHQVGDGGGHGLVDERGVHPGRPSRSVGMRVGLLPNMLLPVLVLLVLRQPVLLSVVHANVFHRK